MTPRELARLHPRLYHVTTPGAWESISRHGLLPPVTLVTLFGHGQETLADRRGREVPLHHPERGRAVLNDQAPLHMRKLASCLDDGLTADDWLSRLNERVFFWVDESRAKGLLGARTNRTRTRDVLVFDTLGLVTAHVDRVEISPINSGATLRRPTRRGLDTFTPLLARSYGDWRGSEAGSRRTASRRWWCAAGCWRWCLTCSTGGPGAKKSPHPLTSHMRSARGCHTSA